MEDKQVHTFNKGMNVDVDKSMFDSATYPYAENLRLIANGDNFAAENIKGNKYLLSFETLSPVYYITENPSVNITGNMPTVIIVRDEISQGELEHLTVQINYSKDPLKQLSDHLNTSAILKAGYNKKRVAMLETSGNNISLEIYASDGVLEYPAFLYSQAVPYNQHPKVIGSVSIRSNLYVFTTCNTDDLVEDGTQDGQIWKITIDTDDNATKVLLYHGALNFSVKNPIKAKSYYDATDLQKIYWTDEFNTLRHCNVEDTNLLALRPSDMMIVSDASLKRPVVELAGSGSLKNGMIQYAYCLYRKYGIQTNFSLCSYLFHLTDASETSGSDKRYYGGDIDESSNKAVKITISDLDLNYDMVRTVSLFYRTANSTPEIRIIDEREIPQTQQIIVVDDGTVDQGNYSLEEFNIIGTFDFVSKDMEEKDNLLFQANITEEKFDLDWDARAYRFKPTNPNGLVYETKILDVNGISSIHKYKPTASSLSTIESDHDAIQTKSMQTTQVYAGEGYCYNPSTGTLGGWGDNVSYTFELFEYKIDDAVNNAYTQVGSNNASQYSIQTQLDSTEAANNPYYFGYSSPHMRQIVGYQRDEVYRYGIVFKKGHKTSFVKWIGDIKMPKVGEKNGAIRSVPTLTFNGVDYDYFPLFLDDTVYQSGRYAYALYPKFTINNIPVDENGEEYEYEIVRVQRDEDDRTIIASSYLGGVYYSQYAEANVPVYVDNGFPAPWTQALGGVDQNDYLVRLTSPELLFVEKQLRTTDILERIAQCVEVEDSGSSGYEINKLTRLSYHIAPLSSITISEVKQVSQKEIVNIGQNKYSTNFLNVNSVETIPTSTTLVLTNGLGSAYSYADGRVKLEYVNVVRTLPNQYGGNGYSNRSFSTYIPCYQVDDSSGNRLVFGGDTYIGYFEALIYTKYRNENNWYNIGLFPLETKFNLKLRANSTYTINEDVHIQEKADVYDFNDGPYTQEKDFYVYNTAYISEERSRFFTPKPLNFKEIYEYDTRIIASDVKYPNQLIDPWCSYRVQNFIDLSKEYGPINSIQKFRNTLYVFQDQAIAIPSINERVSIPDGSTLGMVIGTGGVLVRADYITNHSGCKHKWGTLSTESGVYYYDSFNNMLNRVGSSFELIADIKGLRSKLAANTHYVKNADNPHTGYGVNCAWDKENREVLFTFHDSSKYTVCYNELLGLLESFHTYHPVQWIMHQEKLITLAPRGTYHNGDITNQLFDGLYLHNRGNYMEFYGDNHGFLVQLLTNKGFSQYKIFEACLMNFYATDPNGVNQFTEFFDIVRAWNDFQYTGRINLVEQLTLAQSFASNEKPCSHRERTWSFHYPRNIVNRDVGDNPNIFVDIDYDRTYKERLRDKYLYTELAYTGSYKVNLPFAIVKFRYLYGR